MEDEQFSNLVGATISKIERYLDDKLTFHTDRGGFVMWHHQDCCECVEIAEIIGDLDDLIGTPIVLAEEVSEEDPNASESGTWTFYKLATVKGHVTIRWLGSSNGYYSESVSFDRLAA